MLILLSQKHSLQRERLPVEQKQLSTPIHRIPFSLCVAAFFIAVFCITECIFPVAGIPSGAPICGYHHYELNTTYRSLRLVNLPPSNAPPLIAVCGTDIYTRTIQNYTIEIINATIRGFW